MQPGKIDGQRRSLWDLNPEGRANSPSNLEVLRYSHMSADKIFLDVDYYNPALEYPGFDSDDDVVEVIPSATPRGCFRLIVHSSDVLPRKKRLAILDAYKQTELGRDASSSETDPRIRLKDMEVSKVHATMFWEEARAGWAIVDMGSKHGTFITPARPRKGDMTNVGESSSSSHSTAIRLSPSRQASLPRALTHGDLVALGSTTFLVHIHESGLPCDTCASDGNNELSLFPTINNAARQEPSAAPANLAPTPLADKRSSLLTLRKQLLSQHSTKSDWETGPGKEPTKYVDRAANRRALQTIHPYRQASSPLETFQTQRRDFQPVLPPQFTSTDTASTAADPSSRYFTTSSADLMQARMEALSLPGTRRLPNSFSRSAAPLPLTSSNIGHGLLSKLGWTPGTALGVRDDSNSEALSALLEQQVMDVDAIDEALSKPEEDEGPHARKALLEPLQVTANAGRNGLGLYSKSKGSQYASFTTNWSRPRKPSPDLVYRERREMRQPERSWVDIRRELE